MGGSRGDGMGQGVRPRLENQKSGADLLEKQLDPLGPIASRGKSAWSSVKCD